jgi:hypothetical protein
MTQNYVKEDNLQTAMAEYQDNMGEGRTLYDNMKENLALSPKSTTILQERASRFMRL